MDRTRRIIDRATWGWTPALEADVRSVGWEAWLEAQLAPDTLDDGEVDELLSGFTTLELAPAELRALVLGGQQQRVIGEVSHAAALRMQRSRRQLFEVMVDFWTNHFNVLVLDQQATIPLQTVHDREVVRAHALAPFGDLLLADARSPAMLVYLDQWLSSSTSDEGVNVNFSRETLELHTLGIVDGVQPYDEDDVLGLANVLAGMSLDPSTGLYLYRDDYHAPIAVSLLDDAWSTPGQTGPDAEQDGVDVLWFLARRPETARHLAWKLCRRFVADDPPDALVDELADVYLAEDTAIVPVLRALFASDALVDAPPKYRRGVEAVVAPMRVVDADVDPNPIGPAAAALHSDAGALSQMGQPLFRYPAPDGYPDAGEDWLSSDSALKRWQWNGLLGRGVVPGIGVDATDLAGEPMPATAGALVDAVVDRLLGRLVSYPDPGFDDVSGTHPFYAEIAWMADSGISTGYPDGTYRPGDPVTRQAMSAFLNRFADATSFAGPATPTFDDVPNSHPFYDEIEWMAAEGISTGYPDGTYRPGDPVTRQAMSAFLNRFADATSFAGPATPTFDDVSNSHPFYDEIEWMAAEGISTGYADGTYRPDAAVTRAAMSAFLFRAAGGAPVSPLPTADRDALVSLIGPASTPVTPQVQATRLPDLVGLVLSTPTFQHR